jgi:hypothetical protein
MDWRDLEKHFSAARLGRYRASCNGDEARAAKAYVSNMLVAEAMMPMLSVLEIALKNGIHQRLATLYQRNDWWEAWAHDERASAGFSTLPETTAPTSHSLICTQPDPGVAEPRVPP